MVQGGWYKVGMAVFNEIQIKTKSTLRIMKRRYVKGIIEEAQEDFQGNILKNDIGK